jgi:hypothetical protein
LLKLNELKRKNNNENKNAHDFDTTCLTAHTIEMNKNEIHTQKKMFLLEKRKRLFFFIGEYFEFHDVNDKENQHMMHHL